MARKLSVLRRHCDEVGRDYAEIEKTAASFLDFGEDLDVGVKRWLDHLAELAAVGIEHVIVSPGAPWDDATLEAVCSALPEVHAIPTGG